MYRWLLLLYPRAYRRERGAEILETVRDVAPARRRVRIALNLARHGLRARLGRPASRSVVGWATLFALACGLFAGSFGSWTAWLGSRPLDHNEVAAVLGQLYPQEPAQFLDSADPPVFEIYGNALSWSFAGDLLLGDGAEYALSTVGGSFDHLPDGDRAETLRRLQERLRGAGWGSSEPVYSDSYGCIPGAPQCDPAAIPSNITVYAHRGDSILEIDINAAGTTPTVGFGLSRATPWSADAAGAAGFLLGIAGGWLLFGWASRRTERGHPAVRGLTKVLLGFALFLWWTPALFGAPMMLSHHLNEPHYRWHPLWEWIGQPTFALPFLLGGLMLVLALGLAALPGRQPAAARLT